MRKIGDSLEIKYVLDLKEFPGSPIEKIIVHDFEQIIQDEEIKVVVEVMGGIEPAYTFVKRSLEAGKSVVTSNKELVAHGAGLLWRLQKKKHLNFLFEASVGGGIPIIRPLNTSLTADDIEEITGILNGTTNYMLSKMYQRRRGLRCSTERSTDNGICRAKPECGRGRIRCMQKDCNFIFCYFGKQVEFEDIYTEGINGITCRICNMQRQWARD